MTLENKSLAVLIARLHSEPAPHGEGISSCIIAPRASVEAQQRAIAHEIVQNRRLAHKIVQMAERVGFEPTVWFAMPGGRPTRGLLSWGNVEAFLFDH